MPDDDLPNVRVRAMGNVELPPRTRVWLPQFGGRYTGHPSVKFGRVTVRGVDFSGVRFEDFDADGTRFVDCDFRGTRIAGFLAGGARQTTFERCRFEATDLRDARPGHARFVGCEFTDIGALGWSAVAAEFVDCRFEGPLVRCKFWGKPWGMWAEPGRLRPARTTNDFIGNDFRMANLEDVSFVGGIDLNLQRLPAGPQYVKLDGFSERVAAVRPIIEAWTPDDVRREAILMLDVYSDDMAGQPDLFANRWETDIPRNIADRVWRLLETVRPQEDLKRGTDVAQN